MVKIISIASVFCLSVFFSTLSFADAVGSELRLQQTYVQENLLNYPLSDDFVVFKYQQYSYLFQQDIKEPLLRVYGSGRVRVHYPVIYKKAGDYEMRMSQQEMNDFLTGLMANGIIEYDKNIVTQDLAEISLNRQRSRVKNGQVEEVFLNSDPDVVDITINTDGQYYSHATGQHESIKIHIHELDVNFKKQQFPEYRGLDGLAASLTKIQALLSDPRLVKLP